jgi:hypothetical protein
MSRYRLPNLNKFPDCCALTLNGECTRLTVSNCQGEKCPFKRTRKEEFDSIQCTYQRLSCLDNLTQNHIAKKYYGGHMPWNEEDPIQTYTGYKCLRYSEDKI